MVHLVDLLLKLGEAREKKIISEEEFKEIKAKLLATGFSAATIAPGFLQDKIFDSKMNSQSLDFDSLPISETPKHFKRPLITKDSRQFIWWTAALLVFTLMIFSRELLPKTSEFVHQEAPRARMDLNAIPDNDPTAAPTPNSDASLNTSETLTSERAPVIDEQELITLGARLLFKNIEGISLDDKRSLYESLGLHVNEDGQFFSSENDTTPSAVQISTIDLNNDGVQEVFVRSSQPTQLTKQPHQNILFLKSSSGSYQANTFTGAIPVVAETQHVNYHDLIITQENAIREVWQFNGQKYTYSHSLIPGESVATMGKNIADGLEVKSESVQAGKLVATDMSSLLSELDGDASTADSQALVTAWLSAINSKDMNLLTRLYGSEVRYFGNGIISNADVRKQKLSDMRAWTSREFQQIGKIKVSNTKDPKIKLIFFQMSYTLKGDKGISRGTTSRKFAVRKGTNGLLIVNENNATRLER